MTLVLEWEFGRVMDGKSINYALWLDYRRNVPLSLTTALLRPRTQGVLVALAGLRAALLPRHWAFPVSQLATNYVLHR